MDNFTESARPPNHQPQSHGSFLCSSADIMTERDQLDGWLRNRNPALDEIRVYDILLAANELMVNAFEHGAAAPGTTPGCLFDVQRTGQRLTITVTNGVSEATILPASSWAMPQALQSNGRGLAIVKKLADDVVLTATNSSVTIAAMFDLAPRKPATPARSAAVAV